MSRTHDGQHRSIFPFGNPFKVVRTTKDSGRSARVGKIQKSFEKTLTENLTKLRPEEGLDILSFSWVGSAMGYLCDLYKSIGSLITELELPVSKWEQQWIDIYLDDSVKLLDLCTAFSSGISHIEHCQLLLRCTLHILGKANGSSSQEQLKKAHGYLSEWRQTINSRNPKLETSAYILKAISGAFHVPSFKKSGKGRVLMRAMYAVKAITIFVCSMLFAAMTSSSPHLIDYHVSQEFPWAEAFNGLQSDVKQQIRRKFSSGRVAALKEVDAVGCCVDEILFATGNSDVMMQNTLQTSTVSEHKEPEELQATDEIKDQKLTVVPEVACKLEFSTKILGDELDGLAKKVRNFFQIVMEGRNALLINLKKSELLQVRNFTKSRSI